MKRDSYPNALVLVSLIVSIVLLWAPVAGAQTKYKTLHKFHGSDGASPTGTLILDKNGTLYGTAGGGIYQTGVVFSLSRNSKGGWTEKVLHNFADVDGLNPFAGVVLDALGNLYGTTSDGGAFFYGTAFKLTPQPDGSWTETVLHSFNLDGKDGMHVVGGITLDHGNLYGTTMYGGDTSFGCSASFGCGIVYKLAPNSDGSWSETVLLNFSDFSDGVASPGTGVVLDSDGTIFGAGRFGGIFALASNSGGTWVETDLATVESASDLLFDPQGNLYFTSWGDGDYGLGAVWQLTRNSDGSWTSSVIHSFAGKPSKHPFSGLARDAAGNLYGTTYNGGSADGGTVFKMTPKPDGTWTFKVLHTFAGTPGLHPFGGLVLDNAGNLYGTTQNCGPTTNCHGVVFQLTR